MLGGAGVAAGVFSGAVPPPRRGSSASAASSSASAAAGETTSLRFCSARRQHSPARAAPRAACYSRCGAVATRRWYLRAHHARRLALRPPAVVNARAGTAGTTPHRPRRRRARRLRRAETRRNPTSNLLSTTTHPPRLGIHLNKTARVLRRSASRRSSAQGTPPRSRGSRARSASASPSAARSTCAPPSRFSQFRSSRRERSLRLPLRFGCVSLNQIRSGSGARRRTPRARQINMMDFMLKMMDFHAKNDGSRADNDELYAKQ